ncbi:MAG: transferrin receptor-like dimerization domain-containing protein [Chitinophagaceae bacterium]|nr:M28 family peptidase [Chitinophagaceae bacterium]HQV05779.1 transferrin receptor-like dimerization domain-containing protein [Chitinophagaceae bacterium]
MNKNLLCLALCMFLVLSISAQKIMGFTEAAAQKQIAWEKLLDENIQASNQDQYMQFLTSHPHHVGSPQDEKNAKYMADLFKKWGYQTSIESYYVLFPTPKLRKLELLGDNYFNASLMEPVVKEDKTSGQLDEQLPPYNAYSADGDVTAELVFVNRGVPADYEELDRRGISVKGKIVIAKYGGSWRGIKPKVAAEHGAIGCIIYSDPADDGYARGDTYPKGGFRPKEGAQRGSVMDMPIYPGDPLTPNIGATKDAKRLKIAEVKTIMKIPVIPISWGDALPFLKSLQGEVVPPSWRGGLPITYHIGPSNEKVHLQLAFNWDIKKINDVIAKIPGSVWPDEWVIAGNHHDAWVNGAQDPISGMVAELEDARAIGELVKKGFAPKRTIVFCAWDGEEPALLGSTEWAEDHQKEIQQKAVAYINTDDNGRGYINAGGSHTFEPFFNEIIEQVIDPETGVSLKERKYAQKLVNAKSTDRSKLMNEKDMKLDALGAGSDWGSFLQHLGIPTLQLGFGGEEKGTQYHSTYDSYDFFTRFIDPHFFYGVALSQTTGRVIMRLANAELMPIDFTSFYTTLCSYIDQIKKMLSDTRRETADLTEMQKEKLFSLVEDPDVVYAAPKEEKPVPFLNFSSLDNAMVSLKKASETFKNLYKKGFLLSADKKKKLNEILYKAEQSLLQQKGLPNREWYRHQIYAPGFYTGYGVKTIPGVRESIEQRKWNEAQTNIVIVANTIQNYTAQILAANKLLE